MNEEILIVGGDRSVREEWECRCDIPFVFLRTQEETRAFMRIPNISLRIIVVRFNVPERMKEASLDPVPWELNTADLIRELRSTYPEALVFGMCPMGKFSKRMREVGCRSAGHIPDTIYEVLEHLEASKSKHTSSPVACPETQPPRQNE